MIIGVTGTIGAGKESVVDYLVSKGFAYFSFSKLIREEAKQRGFGMDRQSLEDLGDLIRKENGDVGYFAKKILGFQIDFCILTRHNPLAWWFRTRCDSRASVCTPCSCCALTEHWRRPPSRISVSGLKITERGSFSI